MDALKSLPTADDVSDVFFRGLTDIYKCDNAVICERLEQLSQNKLKSLRDSMFEQVIQLFPSYAGRELVSRRKNNTTL